MVKCRKGHTEGVGNGKQCLRCKREWAKAHPTNHNQARTERRAKAPVKPRLPYIEVWHLGVDHPSVRMRASDRACKVDGSPTAFGICMLCMGEMYAQGLE